MLKPYQPAPWTKQHDEFLLANYESSSVPLIAECLRRQPWEILKRYAEIKDTAGAPLEYLRKFTD